MDNFKKYLLITARITSALSIGFLLFMIIGHLFGEKDNFDNGFQSWNEVIAFIFFPIGLIMGLFIAWKRERLGGICCLVSWLGFHLATQELSFVGLIDVLYIPGLLFLIYGILQSRRP